MWLKIKVWTKVVLFALLVIYSLIFIFVNSNKTVSFWYFPGREPEMPALVMVLSAFAAGVLLTILVRTTLKTLGQFRELQSRTRSDRLHREVEQMKTKAAMLRTREEPLSPPGFPVDELPK